MKRINVKLDVEMVQKCTVCGKRIILEDFDPEEEGEEEAQYFTKSECCGTTFVITSKQGILATKETVDLFRVNYANLTIQQSPLPIRIFQRWYQSNHPYNRRMGTGIDNKEDYKYFQKNYPFDFYCSNSDLYHAFLATIDTGIGRDGTFILTHRRDHLGDRFGPQGCRDLDCILGISSENDLPAFIFQGRQYLSIFSRQTGNWPDGITIYEARIIRRSRTILDLSHQDVYVTKAKFPGDRKETYLMGTNREELLKLTRKKLEPPKKKKVKKSPRRQEVQIEQSLSSGQAKSGNCEMIMIDSIVGHHHTAATPMVRITNVKHFKETYEKKKTGWLKRLIGR